MIIDDLIQIKLNGTVFYTFVFIIGSCIGSFLNVVIYRLPIILKNAAYNDAVHALDFPLDGFEKLAKFNLSYPQSHCPSCKNNIPAWANIPILGFFFTKMRCHYCHLPISFRYPLIESITAILFLAISIIMPNILEMLLGFLYISIFVSIILISYDKNPLPKSLSIFLIWVGFIANTQHLFNITLKDSVIGAILGLVIITSTVSISLLKTHKLQYSSFINSTNIDVAIIASIIGAWFGWYRLLVVLLVVFLLYSFTYKLDAVKLGKFYLSTLISLAGLISIFIFRFN